MAVTDVYPTGSRHRGMGISKTTFRVADRRSDNRAANWKQKNTKADHRKHFHSNYGLGTGVVGLKRKATSLLYFYLFITYQEYLARWLLCAVSSLDKAGIDPSSISRRLQESVPTFIVES